MSDFDFDDKAPSRRDNSERQRRQRDDGFVSKCEHCKARLFIKNRQAGKRIRCPKCRQVFVDSGSTQTVIQDQPQTVIQDQDQDQQLFELPSDLPSANDANELVSVNLKRAKTIAKFDLSPEPVFKALVQAIRSFECDLLEVDRKGYHVRFSICLLKTNTVHDAYVFDLSRKRSEVELNGVELSAGNSFERQYEAILTEVGKYLTFVEESTREEEERADRRSRQERQLEFRDRDRDRDDDRRRQREEDAWEPGPMIAFVILTLLIPLVGIILGCLNISNRKRKGQAIALLIISIVMILAYMERAGR